MKKLLRSPYPALVAGSLLSIGLLAVGAKVEAPRVSTGKYFGEEFAAAHRALDGKAAEEPPVLF